MRARSYAGLAGAFFVATIATAARASPSETDRALAQALFDEGRVLMEAGDYAPACERFAHSQKLDAGGGTLLNLAVCHEREGKIATAYVEFNDALGVAVRDGRKDREDLARERVQALAGVVPRLRLTLAELVPQLEVSIDGNVLPAHGLVADATPIPIDPGVHAVEARAPGRTTYRTEVRVTRAATVIDVHVPPLAARGPAPMPGAAPSSRGRTIGGAVVGGAGLVVIALGAAYGVDALSKQRGANEACPNVNCAKPDAVALSDRAVTSAWVANVCVGTGLVALAVGAYLVITAPKDAPRAAQLGGLRF